ncbi:MAG: hypothetical protein V7756_01760 [Halopseudomonas sp.]|uniref:hypothetical protein n=1 Tax=Halopseudomonas sp. TaxID=2901191 RepID=UPI003001CC45
MSDAATEEQRAAEDAARGQSGDESLPQELIEQLTAWVQHSLAAGGELANLFRLELQLTLGDARRLLFVGLALAPMVLLCWISLGVLGAWLVYEASGSATLGFTTFAALQLVVVAILVYLASRYRRQLGFNRTKTQFKRLVQGVRGEAPRAD